MISIGTLAPKNYNDTGFITSIRGVAAFMVFFIHSGGAGLRDINDFFNAFVESGKFGVQIFFVISGFTIYNQLRTGKLRFKSFIFRRYLRLSLPYFPILIVFFIIYGIFNVDHYNYWSLKYSDGHISFANFVAHIFYLSPYNIEWQTTVLGVDWTLGVEFFYYVFFGVVLTSPYCNSKISSLLVPATLILLLSYFGSKFLWQLYPDSFSLQWSPFLNGYGLMFLLGGFSEITRNTLKKTTSFHRLNTDILLLILILIYFIILVYNNFRYLELYVVMATGIAIIFFDIGKKSIILKNRLLLFFGTISYSFYLLHTIIIQLFNGLESPLILFGMSLLFSIIISTIWYVIFEKKIYQYTLNKLHSKLLTKPKL